VLNLQWLSTTYNQTYSPDTKHGGRVQPPQPLLPHLSPLSSRQRPWPLAPPSSRPVACCSLLNYPPISVCREGSTSWGPFNSKQTVCQVSAQMPLWKGLTSHQTRGLPFPPLGLYHMTSFLFVSSVYHWLELFPSCLLSSGLTPTLWYKPLKTKFLSCFRQGSLVLSSFKPSEWRVVYSPGS
jgi:hypothetical protein